MLNLFKRQDVSTMSDVNLSRLRQWSRDDLVTKKLSQKARQTFRDNADAADAELQRRSGK